MSVGHQYPEQVSTPATIAEREGQLSVAAWTFLAVSAAVLGVVIPSWAAGWRGPDALPEWLAWGITAYATARLMRGLVQAPLRLFTYFFWLFVYIWFGLCGIAQTTYNQFPLRDVYSDDALIKAELVIVLGLLAFDAARWLGSRGTSHGFSAEVAERRIVLTRTLVLSAVGILSSGFVIAQIGGISPLLQSRQALDQAIGAVSTSGNAAGSMRYALLQIPIFVALLFLIRLYRDRGPTALEGNARLGIRFLLVAVGGMNLLVNNPISSSRYWAGTVLLGLLLTFTSLDRPWKRRGVVLAGVIFTVIIFPYSDATRYGPQATRVFDIQGLSPQEQLRYKGDYDAFQQVANTDKFVDSNGYAFGEQLLGPALFWLPRSVWPSKPRDSSVVVGEGLLYKNANLSLPLWAEGYLNFGFVGVLLLLALVGYTASRIDWLTRRHTAALTLASVGVPVVSAYQVILLRGSLLQATGRIVVLLAVLFFGTERRRTLLPDSAISSERSPEE